ncbi:N-terminal nucleophile aminohydrolase [Rhizodiscina lignyota]|uniref:N-terminal nucleophile aminohydrolase n=1 Tax=Rhizodiscina lignyota TaxID=1504668 RepID=A0A9P4M2S3_9PEZI|nr:N-terminal nucleophile aminohydrolase [Rhizodiscina lignyota]
MAIPRTPPKTPAPDALVPKKRGGDIRAIFVHAGAGYHSVQNQNLHLKACEDACKAAMYLLKSGATAVEACEIAIRVLEDKEITNAGYGSNLAVDGVVECDAVVVDHFGRSGAVGAVAQIQNPIVLARKVLDHSMEPLTLKRVAPNLLVGQGATDFAYEMGLPILPHDALVSPGARERWKRWVEDLRKAEKRKIERIEKLGITGGGFKRKRRTPNLLPRDLEQEKIREMKQEGPSPSAGTPIPHVPTITEDNKSNDRDDMIIDTVGAIAIDVYGNIAAGASSGGIGMKRRGRIGPAALVNVGAAVIPISEGDDDRTCTAAVTSGTGEHMTTTMAAGVCAERLYRSVKSEGAFNTPSNADAMDGSVGSLGNRLGHPSVKNSNCGGAIGVLAIKKTSEGAFLYFAHNTDSFALASMHANEPLPVCCMSRSPGGGAIAQGGRAMRFKKRKN